MNKCSGDARTEPNQHLCVTPESIVDSLRAHVPVFPPTPDVWVGSRSAGDDPQLACGDGGRGLPGVGPHPPSLDTVPPLSSPVPIPLRSPPRSSVTLPTRPTRPSLRLRPSPFVDGPDVPSGFVSQPENPVFDGEAHRPNVSETPVLGYHRTLWVYIGVGGNRLVPWFFVVHLGGTGLRSTGPRHTGPRELESDREREEDVEPLWTKIGCKQRWKTFYVKEKKEK